MEIRTTLVTVRFPKAGMGVKSPDAQLFIVGTTSTTVQEWIPNKKLIIEDDPNDDNYKLVTMPKWVWMKTKLPAFFQAEESTHIEEVNKL